MTTPAEIVTTAEDSAFAPRKVIPAAKAGRGRIVGIVTVLTLAVAVLGYVREAALAAHFGVTSTMDAYFGAIFIPTNLYLIVVVGTVSPILIPILLHDKTNDPVQTSETFSIVTNFVLTVFVVAVILGVATARWWLAWLFPGFDAGTRTLALKLIGIIFPALPVLALSGVLTAVLNGFHKYSLAAFAPAVSSIAVIVAALAAHGPHAIYVVGFSAAVGFLLQCLILVPATRSLGIRYKPKLSFRHPAIRRLIQLGTPLILYLLVANASLVIERNLASRLSAGALASITYAMRLFTVPSNFLAAPLVIVAYPYFAREALREDYGELRQELARTLRFLVFLFVPITVWLIVNALPITRALYQHGQFNLADSVRISRLFQVYAIGILPNAITVPLLRCFYAVEDTLTPLWAESIDLLFFMVCAPWLTHRLGITGLALVRGMTFVLVAAILLFVLWARKGLLLLDRNVVPFLTRITVATLAMGVASWYGLQFLQSLFDGARTAWQFSIVSLQIVLGGSVFLGAAFLLRMSEANQLLRTASSLLHTGQQKADATG